MAVREYVDATAPGEAAEVDDIELTADHFARALEAVDPESEAAFDTEGDIGRPMTA